MSELDPGLKIAGHALMVGELPAIVIGDGMHLIPIRREALPDGGADGLGRLAWYGLDHSLPGLALHQRHQRPTMAFADHGVSLPVAKATAAGHDRRARLDRDLVGNDAAPVVGSIAYAPRLLTAQMAVEVTA